MLATFVGAALTFPMAGKDRLSRELLEAERKTNAAREQFPFQSIEERIPKGKPITLTKPLTAPAAKRIDKFEEHLDYYSVRRANLLKQLHERTRQLFVQAPGAGSGRDRFFIKDETILMWVDNGPPAAQPGAPADFPSSPGELLTTLEPDGDHYLYHESGATGFLNPAGFGYIQNRARVAGFAPHGFGAYFGQYIYKPMNIDHVQLVGILMQEQPVVYLTDGLPSMEQVRQGKTRTLDPFEEAGLRALCDGEDLFVAAKGDTLRMLGSLRATKQCLKCHDAQRGDLLGALSYTLRPKRWEPVKGDAPLP
jgi:hypothetical protein